MEARPAPFPSHLRAPGTSHGRFRSVAQVADVALGAMVRVTQGDLDVLVAHTPDGLFATEDRCPHMSAPLSQGRLEGCVVDCPLHQGRFDLSTGGVVQFPTTGGLDADGNRLAPWAPPGRPEKPEPTDAKARARAGTRVRRIRYYPLRIVDGTIEVVLPE